MPTSTSSGDVRPEGRARIDGPFISFDVPFEVARLQAERAYAQEGHTGRTLTKYADLRVVLEAMKSGTRMPLHESPERLTVQVILGQLRLWLEHGENCDVAEGGFAAVEASRVHEIECLEDCAFLLTLAWPPRGERPEKQQGSGI